MKKIKQFWKKNWWVILGIIIGGFFILKATNNNIQEKENIIDEIPYAETISFGSWSPNGNKTIIGIIQSESNIKIPAELNGKIKKIFVDMGDDIHAGQALASFDIQGDLTYINYKNSLNALESTKENTKSSILSAKLNITNAKNEYQQLLLQLAQDRKSSLEGLKNTIKTISTNGLNILNYFDGQVGASDKYQSQYAIARHHIGSNNQILKTKVKNNIRSVRNTYENLIIKKIPDFKEQLLFVSNQYLNFLKELKNIAQNYNILIQGSIVTNTFPNSLKQTVSQNTENQNIKIDQNISQLDSQIQVIKKLEEQQKNQILASKNRIKSLESNLELIKTQSEGQIKLAQNSLNLAASQKADLIVRAPFSGRITEKFIREGQLVSPGMNLFSMINSDKEKKVVAFLSPSEINQLQKTVKIKYDDEIIQTTKFIEGLIINPQTQKIRVDFIIPKDKNVITGKNVKILLSSDIKTKMVPLSAISFEPDGTQEVLVLNNNSLQRKKVKIKNNIADGVEILSGLNINEKIVKYKKQFYSGQKVKN